MARSCPGTDASYDLVPSPSGVYVAARTLRSLGRAIPDWAWPDAETLGALLPRAWVPLALAWIEHESGGRLGSTGLARLDERGLFQISRAESIEILGLSDAEHQRLSTDRAWSLRAGAALLLANAQRAVAVGVPDRAPSQTVLAKLMHGGGIGYTRDLLEIAARAGVGLGSWPALLRAWKTMADEKNVLAGRCLVHVDSADAIRLRAVELAPVVHGEGVVLAGMSGGGAAAALFSTGAFLTAAYLVQRAARV